MNLKDFKRIAEDKDSYTVEHPSGKRLFLEKAKLSESAHKHIQCMASGGPFDGTEGDSTTPSANISQMGGGDPMASVYQALPETRGAIPAADAEDDEIAPGNDPPATGGGFVRQSPNTISPSAQAGIDAIRAQEGPVPGDDDYKPNRAPTSQDPIVEQKSGQGGLLQEQIQQQEEALAATQAAGKDVAAIQQGGADALAKLPSYNDIVANYQAKDAKLAQAYADQKIDPQHYIHSMGTGSKILTGIGLALSGMGAATTGQPSYAMGVVNDAIKKDVEAQESDKSSKMNLWKMNREAMGNDTAANLATENQLKAGVVAKLQAAQARAQLPVEKLRAQQSIDQLKAEMLKNNMVRGVLTQGQQAQQGQGPSLSGTDPSFLVPEMVKDPNQQKQVYEEIKTRANIAKNGGEMLKAFDQAANEVSGVGGVLHSGVEMTPGQLKLEQLMMPNMSELDGTIRQTAVNTAHDTMIPGMKDLGRADRIANKRQSLVNWMESQKSAPVSKGNYIDLDRFQSTAIPNSQTAPAPNGKAMPQAQTQVMHGHTYQKVQGGWKLVK